MPFGAGQIVYEDDLNNLTPARIGHIALTSDGTALSGSTEAVQTTLTVDVVAGVEYEIRWFIHVSSATAADSYQVRVREGTTTAGNQFGMSQSYCPTTGTVGFENIGFAPWTAPTTGSQSFALCLARNGSAGTGQLRAASNRPCYFQVWRTIVPV